LLSCRFERHKHVGGCKYVFAFPSLPNTTNLSRLDFPGWYHGFQVVDAAVGERSHCCVTLGGRGERVGEHPPAVRRVCEALRAVAVVTTLGATRTMCRSDCPQLACHLGNSVFSVAL